MSNNFFIKLVFGFGRVKLNCDCLVFTIKYMYLINISEKLILVSLLATGTKFLSILYIIIWKT